MSWLKHAKSCEDLDSKFIFLWIAFNAAYANDTGNQRIREYELYEFYVKRLAKLDQSGALNKLVWQQYTGSIRVLMDNPYVFQRFWDFHNLKPGVTEWEQTFQTAKQRAHKALAQQDTGTVLCLVLERLYTLRNQLIHGGATHESSINRAQMRDGVKILEDLLPVLLTVMMDNSKVHWGEANYPVMD